MKSCLTNDTFSKMRLSGESRSLVLSPGGAVRNSLGCKPQVCKQKNVSSPGGATRGFRMTEHVAVRATPPGFDYRVDVLGFTPQAIACHASGVSNHTRLRRSEPCPPLAFRTIHASGVSNHTRLRRFESCHPTPFEITFATLSYKPKRRFDSSSKKSTSLKGSCPMSCQRIFPEPSIK